MFDEKMVSYVELIENGLNSLDFSPYMRNRVSDASKYAVMNGGKRIRPILLLEFCKLFGGEISQALPFAYGLELIHNYSLVHDDLPCMDDDDYRRGNPTVHKKYGYDIGVLCGDNLLNMAYEIMLEDIIVSSKDIQMKKVQALKFMADHAGIKGMIGGQVMDIENTYDTIEQLVDMYDKKTCGLIKSACVCGAIIGGADPQQVNMAKEFGECLGMAFQIQDDLLDLEQDEKINKVTYVSLSSLEKSKAKIIEYNDKAVEILHYFNKNTDFLNILLKKLTNRDF